MLRNLGGEHLEVTGLMGPGVDPHLYRAVPADIERLAAADMIFYNGLHLEGRMADLFEKLAERKPTFAVTHSLVEAEDPRLRKPPEFEGYYDPHVWHDPKLWAECVKYVADVLGEVDPAHRDDYVRNRDAYLEAARRSRPLLPRAVGARFPKSSACWSRRTTRSTISAHAYGLTSMPLKGVSTEDEVTIGRMDEVVEFLVERKIKAVFVESARRRKSSKH